MSNTSNLEEVDAAVNFNDQALGADEDGDASVLVEDVETAEESAVVVTYGENQTIAGLTTGEWDADDVVVEIEDDGGFPGEYTTHVIPQDDLTEDDEVGEDISDEAAGPVQADGDATVFDATLTFKNQTFENETSEVTIDTADLLNGDDDETEFVVDLHPTDENNMIIGDEAVGQSGNLTGANENVTVDLKEPIDETDDYRAMLRKGPSDKPLSTPAIEALDEDELATVTDSANVSIVEEKREKRDTSRVNTRTREERREQAEREWRLRPIEQFLKEREGEITSRNLQGKERTVRRFDRYLHEEIAPHVDASILDLRDVVEADIASFRDDELKPDPNLTDSTVEHKLGALSHFYNVLEENNAFAGNPVKGPLKTFKQNHDLEADRPHIPFHRMQRFVNWLTLPFSRAFWLSGLKHGTRFSEVVNIDLRCLHIDHPVFWQIVENHDVRLDPRVRDKPDTLLIYEGFNEGDEIPNEETPGPETGGEIRDSARGNKRKEDGGSILPLDSELKTALIEWLLTRPPTYDHVVNPLFVFGGSDEVRRPTDSGIQKRLWSGDSYTDSIQQFGSEESLDECPDCGGSVIEENLEQGKKSGRRFRCRDCRTEHWRSIYWDNGLVTEQKMTFHEARHYFTNGHDPGASKLHDGGIPDKIRKKRIRGDSDKDGDTEDDTYKDKNYEDYDRDIRQPYLDGIYKFDLYDSVIPAVGEGWQ